MTKCKQYPDECPVFEVNGEHVEIRPGMINYPEDNPVGELTSYLLAFTGPGIPSYCWTYSVLDAKPLTKSARQLYWWARQ